MRRMAAVVAPLRRKPLMDRLDKRRVRRRVEDLPTFRYLLEAHRDTAGPFRKFAQARHVFAVDAGRIPVITQRKTNSLLTEVGPDERDLLPIRRVFRDDLLEASVGPVLENMHRPLQIEGHHLGASRRNLRLTLGGVRIAVAMQRVVRTGLAGGRDE